MNATVALCGLLAIAHSGVAQSVHAQEPALAEATIRGLDDQERVAVLHSDRAALERLWSEHLTVNAPTNRVNIGRDAVLALIQRGGLHYSVFERTVETVRIEGDMAIVMGAEVVRAAGDSAATAPEVHRRFTNIWKQEGGTWRLIARHANAVLPP